MYKTISIIPARGGSKGVPHKNIKSLGGYPLIAYSILASNLSELIEETYVSSDSDEILNIASKYGAKLIKRPDEIAQDKSVDIEFMQHALKWIEENEKQTPQYIVHLRPTTPLREVDILNWAIESLTKSVLSTSLKSVHEMMETPFKCFKINDKNFLEGLLPDDKRPEYYNLPRQSFPTIYRGNGYIDIVKSDIILKRNLMYGERMLPLETPKQVEIDTKEEFEYLEWILIKYGNEIYDYLKSHFKPI